MAPAALATALASAGVAAVAQAATRTAYLCLLGVVAAERVAEMAVARRNAARSFARGGREYGRGHYPAMVALHVGLLLGCALEPPLLHRPFAPALGWPALALVAAAQALRWWCIATLGPLWNTRVIVVPGLARVHRGPYRRMRHPNYLAVTVEGAALPLVHSAWLTAAAFTALNAVLLRHRIRVEEDALAEAAAPRPDNRADSPPAASPRPEPGRAADSRPTSQGPPP